MCWMKRNLHTYTYTHIYTQVSDVLGQTKFTKEVRTELYKRMFLQKKIEPTPDKLRELDQQVFMCMYVCMYVWQHQTNSRNWISRCSCVCMYVCMYVCMAPPDKLKELEQLVFMCICVCMYVCMATPVKLRELDQLVYMCVYTYIGKYV